MNRLSLLTSGFLLAGATTLFADFQYQQTTKVTGGAMAGMLRMAGAFSKQAREPIVSDVYVKGNRMAHVNQHRADVIDLDKETITNIDFDKKQYSVMTFQQMKEAMEEALAKAKQQKSEGSGNADLNFKVSVTPTKATRQVAGLEAKEFIMNLLMEATDKKSGEKGSFAITNDMWMAPEIKGYSEVRDFQMRMAQKMGSVFSGGGFNPLALGRADMAKGMQEMAKEVSKLKGIPVLQVMRMGTSPDGSPLPAASQAPEAAQSKGPDVKEAAGKAAAGAALGRLGGLGGFGRSKKKQDEEQPASQGSSQQQAQSGPAILLESTTETTGFSAAAVDASKFEVPAGFKQVEAEATKRRGR